MSDEVRNITIDLIETAKTAPESLALIVGDRHVSYSELDASVWGAARYLSGKGVRKGDTVALIFSGQLPLAFALLGAMRLGAVSLVLSPSLTPIQRDELIADSNVRFLFSDNIQFKSASKSSITFDETCLTDKSENLDLLCASPEAYGQIIVGSGSTGKPYLIPVSHQNFRARTRIIRHSFSLKPGHRFMLVTPIHFATPIARFLGALSAGATCVLWDQRTQITSAIERAQPDILELTVYHAEKILQMTSKLPGFDLSGLRIVTIGFSTISEDLRRRLKEDLKANLHITYGTNEVGAITFAYPDDLTSAKGGVGRPPPSVTLEIVDTSGRRITNGDIGHIRMKSPAKIDGYLDVSNPDRFRDGWFYPGDLGKLSEDGQLIHCGRADQMMILDGINIYPAELERVLGEHPAVHDIAVFPVRHLIHQDIPVGAVSLKPDARTDELELRTYARELLGVRAPKHIFIVEELPRNGQGKLVRRDLERLMLADLKRQGQKPKSENGRGENTMARQRMHIRKLKIMAPTNLSLEILDAWRPYLENDTLSCETRKFTTDFPPEVAPVAAWFEHVLALARDFLLAVHIPCFENIILHECKLYSENRDKNAIYEAVIELPELENYGPGTFHRALSAAVSSTDFMQWNPPLETNREHQFSLIRKNVFWAITQGTAYGSCTNRVLHAAYQKGIPFCHIGLGVYQVGWGASATLIDRSTSTKDSAMSNKLTFYKQVTASLIRSAGLPAPVHSVVKNLDAARKAAERIGWPVVIKPEDQERGEGVQVDVQAEQLESAFNNALGASQGNRVLVERQVNGVCHRLFIAGGQLLYAVKRLPIGVYGDGVRTVSELVQAECATQRLKPIWTRSKIRPLDDLGRAAIESAGLSQTSVPEKEQFVALRRIESTEWGGVDEEVTEVVHPENIRIALAATTLCGLDVAGVDIITEDISKPWAETGAIINEVNYKPLLGGGKISRRYLPEYLDRLMGGSGRIPVKVFVGDERALDAAKAHHNALIRRGIAAYLTNDSQTLGASGQELLLARNGLHARVRALVLSGDVEAIAIVVQTDSLLVEGLPLEGVDEVHVVGEVTLTQSSDAPNQRRQYLMKLLSDWVWPRELDPPASKPTGLTAKAEGQVQTVEVDHSKRGGSIQSNLNL